MENDAISSGYKSIKTEDGSYTLWSERFQEHCHTLSGARTETLEYYIYGTNLKRLVVNKGAASILEIGFGTGLGVEVTKEELDSLNHQYKCFFLSTEIDPELVELVKQNHPKESLIGGLKTTEYFSFPCYENKVAGFHLIVLIGNAVDMLDKLKEKHPHPFDVIYQDAFSPPKSPELWSEKWFSLLRENFTKNSSILSTYSASQSVRDALKKSGWTVHHAKGFGKKRASTRATLTELPLQ
jgi:tRNA U34 5-methylaminomethyl-2-thiouridine-forming methyltransferase MnmC